MLNKIKETIPKEENLDEKKESDKILPNKGNGSKTDTYYWTQTLEELTIFIPLPQDITKKQLNVNIGADKIHVSTKDSNKVFIAGDWSDKISIDDLNWCISSDKNRKIMEIYVTKWRNTMTWWDSVIKSEPKIDTQKINPEPSKLGDLDGEM